MIRRAAFGPFSLASRRCLRPQPLCRAGPCNACASWSLCGAGLSGSVGVAIRAEHAAHGAEIIAKHILGGVPAQKFVCSPLLLR
jgi:hypothetical protein